MAKCPNCNKTARKTSSHVSPTTNRFNCRSRAGRSNVPASDLFTAAEISSYDFGASNSSDWNGSNDCGSSGGSGYSGSSDSGGGYSGGSDSGASCGSGGE